MNTLVCRLDHVVDGLPEVRRLSIDMSVRVCWLLIWRMDAFRLDIVRKHCFGLRFPTAGRIWYLPVVWAGLSPAVVGSSELDKNKGALWSVHKTVLRPK